MSKKAFDKIAVGLTEALAIARSKKNPVGPPDSSVRGQMTLTDEQVEEVRRRLADPNRKLVSHSEARKRIKRLGK